MDFEQQKIDLQGDPEAYEQVAEMQKLEEEFLSKTKEDKDNAN